MKLSDAEILQRSDFQFKLYIYSIGFTGGLVAYGLSKDNIPEAIIIVPYLCSALFMLWVSLAFSIRFKNPPKKDWKDLGYVLRVVCGLISNVFVFFVMPLVALSLYEGKKYQVLKTMGYVLPSVALVFYLIWFVHQYFSNKE